MLVESRLKIDVGWIDDIVTKLCTDMQGPDGHSGEEVEEFLRPALGPFGPLHVCTNSSYDILRMRVQTYFEILGWDGDKSNIFDFFDVLALASNQQFWYFLDFYICSHLYRLACFLLYM